MDGRPRHHVLDADDQVVDGIRLAPGDEVADLDGSLGAVRPVTLPPAPRP
ncbi:hypothetical protein [Streptomyces sp. NPDC059597]